MSLKQKVAAVRKLVEAGPAPAFADLDAVASAFLAVVPAKRVDRTRAALEILLPAYEAGEIYNAQFVDLKRLIDYSFEEAYKERIQVSYWIGDSGYKDDAVKNPDYAIYDVLGYGGGIRNAIAMNKKLLKMKPAEKKDCLAHWETAREFLAACLPLAQVMEVLKTKTVKGRKPLSPEKQAVKAAQLAAKDLKTCACCFREIARYPNGLIADHGYMLPPRWGKTASCPGRQFRPLEVSDDGLKYMVELLTRRCDESEKAIAGMPARTKLHLKTYSNKLGDEIGPDDKRWKQTYDAYIEEFTRDLKDDTRAKKEFEQRLASWKPSENIKAESLGELASQLREVLGSGNE